MFWAAVLPFQITCAVIVVGYAVFVWAAPKIGLTRGVAAGLGVPLAVFGFIPLCFGIDALISPMRFGVFEYATQAEMNDGHADRRIPSAATEITIDQYSAGFRAKYKIDRAELDRWLEREWEIAAEGYAQMDGWDLPERMPTEPGDSQDFDRRFSKYGWTMPADAVELHCPWAPNGAGSELWHSAESGQAYQAAGYW